MLLLHGKIMDHVISCLATNISVAYGFVSVARASVNERRRADAVRDTLPVGYHDLIGAQIVSSDNARAANEEPLYVPPVQFVCDCIVTLLKTWIPEWPDVNADPENSDKRRLAEEIAAIRNQLLTDCTAIRASSSLPDSFEKATGDLLRLCLCLTFRINQYMRYEFAYPIKNPIALLFNKLAIYLELHSEPDRREDLLLCHLGNFVGNAGLWLCISTFVLSFGLRVLYRALK